MVQPSLTRAPTNQPPTDNPALLATQLINASTTQPRNNILSTHNNIFGPHNNFSMHHNTTALAAASLEPAVEETGWPELLLCLCFLVGVYRGAIFVWTVFGPYFRRRLELKRRYGGGWALVTGGSEGIGQAIAAELALSGFSLILVSRSADKLARAQQRIRQLNPSIQVKVHSIDLAVLTTETDYHSAFKDIFEQDISLLVNNVGYYTPDCLANIDYEAVRTEAKLNLLPIAVLTRMFLAGAQRRGTMSGLVNLSSVAGLLAFRGAAHYSATKTYDDYFSQAIGFEQRGKVDVLTVRPFFVTTPMTRNTSSFFHVSPQQTGRAVVDSLGNTDVCYGPLLHRLTGALIHLANRRVSSARAGADMTAFKERYNKSA